VTKKLPDIQHSLGPEIQIPIAQVGVQNVKAPIILDSMFGGTHELLARIAMSTDLGPTWKGISMSKLHRNLIRYLDKPLKHETLKTILSEFKTEVETDSNDSFINFQFEMPVHKKSPKSAHVFPQYYECAFEGRLVGTNFRFFQKVVVPYASYCPCSSSLCDHLSENGSKGYPHAQRCKAEVLVEIQETQKLWLEEIILLVEYRIKTIPYPILQRVDEQEVARIAGENPLFVEDAIRRISEGLNELNMSVKDWIVKCTHEESIHTSDAIAINFKGIEGGFTGTIYL